MDLKKLLRLSTSERWTGERLCRCGLSQRCSVDSASDTLLRQPIRILAAFDDFTWNIMLIIDTSQLGARWRKLVTFIATCGAEDGFGLMNRDLRARARRRLDERLQALAPASRFAVPPRGWIRAIRDALGMSGSQLGQRIGITAQSIQNLEESEANGTAQLNTLRKAAEAMDCVLVYALLPKSSLEGTVCDRERAIAIDALWRRH
eukprot:gene17394-17584_t